MTVVFRHEVPVDDEGHVHALTGPLLHVACRRRGVVEFWSWHDETRVAVPRRFRVVGTGQRWPMEHASYHGTALDGDLVWHLVEEPV